MRPPTQVHGEERVEELDTVGVQLVVARPHILALHDQTIPWVVPLLDATDSKDIGPLEFAIHNGVRLNEEGALHVGAEVVLHTHRLEAFRQHEPRPILLLVVVATSHTFKLQESRRSLLPFGTGCSLTGRLRSTR
jgi:hypothetical protein